MYQYKAKLERVVDGDTVHAMVDLGFYTWRKINIRLYDIDAPETRTRNEDEKVKGFAAKQRLIEILEANGNEFELISHNIDKYGRTLGTIIIAEKNINQQLVQEGHAVKYGK